TGARYRSRASLPAAPDTAPAIDRLPGGWCQPPGTEFDPADCQDSKPERERQEIDQVHQWDRGRVTARQVLDRKIERLKGERKPDRQQDAPQLATAVEFAGQQAGKRNRHKAEDRQRDDQPLVALDAKPVDDHRVDLGRRPKELAEIALLRVAEAD